MEQLAGSGMTSLDIRFVNPLCVLVLIGLYPHVTVSCSNCLLTGCWYLMLGPDTTAVHPVTGHVGPEV
jgi:hypothetical protein